MELTLLGHNYRYAAESAILLFVLDHENLRGEISMTQEDGKTAFFARLSYGEKTGEGACARVCESEREVQNTMKRAIFSAMSKVCTAPTPWGIMTGVRPTKIVRELYDLGWGDDAVFNYLKDEFWVSDDKISLCTEIAKAEQSILAGCGQRDVSLYLHVPFCPTRCVYCSFVSNMPKNPEKELEGYVSAMLAELSDTAQIARELHLNLKTIYMGGGTPTTLSAPLLKALLAGINQQFDLSHLEEFTVEAGRPDTVTQEKLAVLKQGGVTRLCINPQTMHQKTLDKIGRRHTPEDVARCYGLARTAGFDKINADLIAGLPGETPEMFAETLAALLPLLPEAITVHTMYLKRASQMKQEMERFAVANAACVGEMLAKCRVFMHKNGYAPYYMYRQKNTVGNLENVGYCLPGCECRYNVYMMEEEQTILGVGAGATTKAVANGKEKGEANLRRYFSPKDVRLYCENPISAKKRDMIYEAFK